MLVSHPETFINRISYAYLLPELLVNKYQDLLNLEYLAYNDGVPWDEEMINKYRSRLNRSAIAGITIGKGIQGPSRRGLYDYMNPGYRIINPCHGHLILSGSMRIDGAGIFFL